MTVVVKDNGFGVKNIIINEPKTYNSLSFKTLKMLIHTFKRLERDNKTRVIILSGNGKSEPNLDFLPKNHRVTSSDKVYTSGKEGIFLPGIPIGSQVFL